MITRPRGPAPAPAAGVLAVIVTGLPTLLASPAIQLAWLLVAALALGAPELPAALARRARLARLARRTIVTWLDTTPTDLPGGLPQDGGNTNQPVRTNAPRAPERHARSSPGHVPAPRGYHQQVDADEMVLALRRARAGLLLDRPAAHGEAAEPSPTTDSATPDDATADSATRAAAALGFHELLEALVELVADLSPGRDRADPHAEDYNDLLAHLHAAATAARRLTERPGS